MKEEQRKSDLKSHFSKCNERHTHNFSNAQKKAMKSMGRVKKNIKKNHNNKIQ